MFQPTVNTFQGVCVCVFQRNWKVDRECRTTIDDLWIYPRSNERVVISRNDIDGLVLKVVGRRKPKRKKP